MTIKEQIEKDLGAAFTQAGLDKNKAVVMVSAIDICDYQCNACFALGKELGIPPFKLSQQIAGIFRSDTASCEAVPPAFLNFKVTDSALTKTVNSLIETEKLPIAAQPQRTVFFDYGGANIAKELHVGHLRSPIVGEALKRVFQALGHDTVSDVYLGDWGLQNGLIFSELEHQNYVTGGKFVKSVTLDVLNEIYPLASRKKDSDPVFKKRADEITLLLQQKQEPWFGLWKVLRKISVSRIRENYDRLGCTFDLYNGESDAQPYVEEVLEILKQQNLAYDDNNCLIMNVANESDKAPMPPIILKKYNGGDLYATNDVATVYYRMQRYKPDEFIYLTDARQSLHFEQVFRCVKLGGLVNDETKLTHIGYGTMNGADGKPFKTRAGGTIKLEEVIELVRQAAAKRLAENKAGGDGTSAQKIGLAALKFADLSNNVRKDYVFDPDKFTSFEGKTGPYILYTIARINSIFLKSNPDSAKAGNRKKVNKQSAHTIYITDNTRGIMVKILKLCDAYPAAAANYTLNGITDAAWALAAAFNIFYGSVNILREQDKNVQMLYLSLCSAVRTALKYAMHTLAIDTVEEM